MLYVLLSFRMCPELNMDVLVCRSRAAELYLSSILTCHLLVRLDSFVNTRTMQGLFTKLLYGEGECTSNGLYCFSGLPGSDAFEVFDVNADDQWSSLFPVDTRYAGGKGVDGEFFWPDILSCLAFFSKPQLHQLQSECDQRIFWHIARVL